MQGDRHGGGHDPGGRSSGDGGRWTAGLDQYGVRPMEADAVHGEPPGEQRQEAVLENEAVESELVPAAGVCARRPDAAESKTTQEREPELVGLEPNTRGCPGSLEERAAELRGRELGECQDGEAPGEPGPENDKETHEPAHRLHHIVKAACSIALV
jgi:hypothetical protein